MIENYERWLEMMNNDWRWWSMIWNDVGDADGDGDDDDKRQT